MVSVAVIEGCDTVKGLSLPLAVALALGRREVGVEKPGRRLFSTVEDNCVGREVGQGTLR